MTYIEINVARRKQWSVLEHPSGNLEVCQIQVLNGSGGVGVDGVTGQWAVMSK